MGRPGLADEAELQIFDLIRVEFRSLTCTVRCLAGEMRVGDQVYLVSPDAYRPIVEALTVSGIELVAGIPATAVDLGRTALVTVTGTVDVAAVRAVASGVDPGEAWRLDLRLVAQQGSLTREGRR